MNRRELKKMMLRAAAVQLETNLAGQEFIHGIPMFLGDDNERLNPDYEKASAIMIEIVDELYRRGTP